MSNPEPATDDNWHRITAAIMRYIRRSDERRAREFRASEARARREEARVRWDWLRRNGIIDECGRTL